MTTTKQNPSSGAVRSPLLSGKELAAYLGMRQQDLAGLSAEDGLPVIVMPGRKRPVRKYSPRAVYAWLVARSQGREMTWEDFLADLAEVRGQMNQLGN